MLRMYLIALLSLALPAAAQDEYLDFSDQVTPVCEIAEISAGPPDGWINVPVDTRADFVQGCQMMLILDEELIGILRLFSYDLSGQPDNAAIWPQHLVGVESVLIAEMGYLLGEVVWSRADVPITGAGFRNARAIGFSASVEGNPYPQEAHFLVFENARYKYLISLLTPGESVDKGAYYRQNTEGMKALMQALRPRQ